MWKKGNMPEEAAVVLFPRVAVVEVVVVASSKIQARGRLKKQVRQPTQNIDWEN